MDCIDAHRHALQTRSFANADTVPAVFNCDLTMSANIHKRQLNLVGAVILAFDTCIIKLFNKAKPPFDSVLIFVTGRRSFTYPFEPWGVFPRDAIMKMSA